MSEQFAKRGRDFDRIDPTDYAGLPDDWWNVGLDYVRQTLPIKKQNSVVVHLFMKASALGAIGSFIVLILAPFVGHLEMLPVFISGSMLFGLIVAMGNEKAQMRQYLLAPLAVLVGWSICFLAEKHVYGVFLAIFIYALLIAEQCSLHFAFSRCAPPVDNDTRERIGKTSRRGVWFWIQFLAIPAIALALAPKVTLFFEQTSASFWAQPLTMAVFAVFLLGWPFVFAFVRNQRCSVADMFRGTWLALRGYVTYGMFPTEEATRRYESAPLTFHSPAGLFKFRKFSMLLAIIGVALALLPFCDYFPTSKVPPAPFDFHALLSVKPDYDPSIPELNAKEQETLHRLRMAPYYASRAELTAKLEQWGHENPEELLPRLIPVRAFAGNWILHAVFGATEDTSSLYNVFISIIFALVAPGVFFFLLSFAVAANYNGAIYAMTKRAFPSHQGSNPTPDARRNEPTHWAKNNPSDVDTAARWDAIVNDLLSSEATRDYLYVGRDKVRDAPQFIHIAHWREHCHYLGGSGRGKTALGLAPLIAQLIRRGDCNVVIFDLKYDETDRSFFESARIEAKAVGHDFKFFTTSLAEPTHLCNPLLETELTPMADVESRASQLCEALGLLYGQKYGESYYTEASIRVARRVLAKIISADGYRLREPLTFPKLLDLLELVAVESKSELKFVDDAAHLQSIIEKYTSIPSINYLPEQLAPELLSGSIQFDHLHSAAKPQVYFFGLNAENDPDRSGGLTRLFLNRLMKAKAPRAVDKRQTFVIVDEFQMAAAPQFTRLLEQARSAKQGLILANQSIPRIKELAGEGLEAALFDNIAYRQVFQVQSQAELQRFEFLAGKYATTKVTKSISTDAVTGQKEKISHSFSIMEESRFDVSDWVAMNANAQQSVMFATKNIGYTRTNGFPVLIESDYHINYNTMKERAEADPPELSPQTTTGLAFSQFLKTQPQQVSVSPEVPTNPKRLRFGNDDPTD